MTEHQLKVLLADDDKLLRRITALALRRLGLECDAVADGEEAVSCWTAGRHGLVLLDVEMPQLRGPDVARAIRALEGGDVPYLVGLTGHDDGRELQAALDAGMNEALSKPLRPAQLALVVDSARAHLGPGGKQKSDEPILDHIVLERLTDLSGDPALVADLIEMFLGDVPMHRAAITGAVDDPEKLARAAHAFKSGTGTMGAKRLTNACRDIELLARSGTTDGVEPMIARMLRDIDDITAELLAWHS